METPMQCAKEIADFLKEKFREYDEKEPDTGAEYNVYAGFLPREDNPKRMKTQCPAVVVRPLLIEDNTDETIAKMAIYAVTYDDDMKFGSESLYHVLQFIRFHLLTNNPVHNRFEIKLKDSDTMETYIPDEQPYPFWQGRLDFAVYLEQPSRSPLAGRTI